MPHGPQRLVLIRAGRYDFADIDLRGSVQIVGPNNTGKTTLINTLQFLYLDDRRHMDFGSYTPEQTRDYYLPDQYSYILFECLGARGRFVLGWRGQSRAAGGEPERFLFEGAFDPADFLDDHHRVREPKAINARLSIRQFTVLRSAQDHREALLYPTKGDSRGMGLVALRDSDKYPQFRETLKNLLCLSVITQDQMRDRLLMLAGLAPERPALDVRELFGEDYDRILRLKQKLIRFKKNQAQVELVIDQCARRDRLRDEMLFRWTDLRAKRQGFEAHHEASLAELRTRSAEANAQADVLQAEIADRRNDAAFQSQAKGAVLAHLEQLTRQTREFSDFVEDLARTSVQNLETEVRTLELQLGHADSETRTKAEQKISLFREQVAHRHRTVSHFDRALITVLRSRLSDDELAPLARLFNFDLLELPVGADGVRIHQPAALADTLRSLLARIREGAYRDDHLELPLPNTLRSLAELADPAAVRERLAEDEASLRHWEGILKAITEREQLAAQLATRKRELGLLRNQLFAWEQFLKARAEEPRLKSELRTVEDALATLGRRIQLLEEQVAAARAVVHHADRARVVAENEFNAVMSRFNTCLFPEFPGRATAPDEAIPDDFDAAVAGFLHLQTQLARIDQKTREGLLSLESTLGGDFAGPDEGETLRLLREELEALPEREEVLRRDWEHHLTHLRGTFDQTLQAVRDVQSAADRLNRTLAGIQVSNLKTLRMDVLEQSDLVGSMRRLTEAEQPGLFDDSGGLEAALDGFRQKFESNPLLRYADLFTLRFTVTGDDGRAHHYHDLRQVESHGTTITIKVLFNLVVLRSLLREDSQKGLLCEVPFFLDEVHSLDAINRRAILTTARKLGFLSITAAPESVSEVDTLYFLQPDQGRIVLQDRHQVRVRPAAQGS